MKDLQEAINKAKNLGYIKTIDMEVKGKDNTFWT